MRNTNPNQDFFNHNSNILQKNICISISLNKDVQNLKKNTEKTQFSFYRKIRKK